MRSKPGCRDISRGYYPGRASEWKGAQGATRYSSPVNEEEGLRVTSDGRCPAAPVGRPSTVTTSAAASPLAALATRRRAHPHDIRILRPPSSHSASSTIPSAYARRQPTRLASHNPSFHPHPAIPKTATPAMPNHTLGSHSESSRYEPTNPGPPHPPSHPPPPGPLPLQLIGATCCPPWVPSRGSPRPSLTQGSAFK